MNMRFHKKKNSHLFQKMYVPKLPKKRTPPSPHILPKRIWALPENKSAKSSQKKLSPSPHIHWYYKQKKISPSPHEQWYYRRCTAESASTHKEQLFFLNDVFVLPSRQRAPAHTKHETQRTIVYFFGTIFLFYLVDSPQLWRRRAPAHTKKR